MFTVKATYRGETRKFTFPECNSFPSFDQLYRQLYRVFPISHNFFLSKLLFSPDSSRSRVLIGQEVHSAEQYADCISRYSVGRWPNPLLKFSVFDETPHKLPNSPAAFNLPQPRPAHRSIQSSTAPQPQNPFASPSSTQLGTSASPFPTISFSHIPPPPIIFSSAASSPQVPMEVTQPSKFLPSPQPMPSVETPKPTACCAATQRKEEVKVLISNLKVELERIVSDLNDMSSKETPATMPSAPRPPSPAAPQEHAGLVFPSLCQFNFCWRCGVIKQGSWYHCGKCDNKICVNCYDASMDSNCLVATGPHVWKKMFCASCPDAPSQPLLSPMTPWGSTPVNIPDTQFPGMTSTSALNASEAAPPTLSSPMLPTLPSVPTVEPRATDLGYADNVANTTAPAEPAPRNVVHYGVVCDVCHAVIEGVRHKCLDCADYDLCTACISSGSAERHNPFHEFIEIMEPGRVIVHTVLSGNGERDAVQPNHQPSVEQESSVPVLHSATCDLCDSRIRGDRYKCVDCPDFDTCQSCFSITREQHPHHAFVRLSKPDDFIRRRESDRPTHFATCNICSRAIYGIRYKCMHSDCPDFDLCETCEAHPIAVHPSTHPLLKMRDASTVVPSLRAEPPVPVPAPTSAQETRDNILEHPSPAGDETGQNRGAVNDLVYQPPSPFFFRTETEGSNSPRERHEPNHDITPPYLSPQRTPSPPLSVPGALPNTFNLPLFTPTSPILRSPLLQPTDEPQHRSPNPAPLTPLWKRMSLPPMPPYSLPPPPPLPQISTRRRTLREEMTESVRQNLLWRRRRNELQPLTNDFGFDHLSIHRTPSPNFGIDNHDRSSSPHPPTTDWLPNPSNSFGYFPVRVPSQYALDSEFRRPESSCRSDNFPGAEEPSISLPPLQSTGSSGLWPENFQEMRHLMDGIPNFERAFHSFFDDAKPVTAENSVAAVPAPEESPLGKEELLNSPPPTDRVVKPEDAVRSLASILNPEPVEHKQTFVEDRAEAEAVFPELPDFEALNAEFVADRSVPDGQEFPPGAEFVKSWSVINTGRRAWPEETELVFVAGEDLALDGKAKPVKVGAVRSGETVDLWTEELKAPDVPGRYISYYRLRDGTGNLFGHSIWLDIVVSETFHRGPSSAGDHTSSEEYSSMSSSSIIVMPKFAPSVPSLTLATQPRVGNSPGSSMPGSPVTAPSSRSDIDVLETVSNDGSEASSVSLVSVPSSPSHSEDEEEELYRDCRTSIHVETSTQTLRAFPSQSQQAEEYVVLYDETTSSEEE